MTVERKSELLELFLIAPAHVAAELHGLADDVLHFRPFADAWTIQEQVVHLLDADINAWLRYRTAIAEPGQPARGVDEEAWTRNLNPAGLDLRVVLETWRMLRGLMHSHLRSIVNEDWSRYTYTHSQRGPEGLERLLEIYTGHVDFHMKLVRRNLKLYRSRG